MTDYRLTVACRVMKALTAIMFFAAYGCARDTVATIDRSHPASPGSLGTLEIEIVLGRRRQVQKLIAEDSDVNAIGTEGQRPLTTAVIYSAEMIPLLMRAGADPYLANENGSYPVIYAVTLDSLDAMRLLIKHGLDVNHAYDGSDPPLSAAIFLSHNEMSQLLLDAGADPNATGKRALTPLWFATVGENIDGINILIDAGAKVNKVNKKGETPLHHAAMGLDGAELCKTLIDRGADVDLPDNKGITPRDRAAQNKDPEVRKLFETVR